MAEQIERAVTRGLLKALVLVVLVVGVGYFVYVSVVQADRSDRQAQRAISGR